MRYIHIILISLVPCIFHQQKPMALLTNIIRHNKCYICALKYILGKVLLKILIFCTCDQ